MTTVSLDCSSGRGRRAPLSLSGLVVSCPVRSGSAPPSLPVLSAPVLCVRKSVTCTIDGGGRAVPCTLIYDPLENTSGMMHILMLAGLGNNPALFHYTSTEPYSSQTPSATGHALYLITPTRETPPRETPRRETRPQHVRVRACVRARVCVFAVQPHREVGPGSWLG